ncbi:MAG: Rv3654c family TadE-like protein [Actinomycetota bacterium]|nr:Rv3654c family TadE-like protein [Actinomycetota bacterium]
MTRPVTRPLTRPRTRRTDSGAATTAAVACLGLLLLVGLTLGEVGAWFAAHRQARAAADLAALAGAGALAGATGHDPCATAGDVAHRNGAEVTSCTSDGSTVEVVVAVDAPSRWGPEAALVGTARAGPA